VPLDVEFGQHFDGRGRWHLIDIGFWIFAVRSGPEIEPGLATRLL
jgi:hypothetical protein